MRISRAEVNGFFTSQLAEWPAAASSFAALEGVQLKTVHVAGATFKVQFNPARIRSTAAKVDAASLKARKCFLCDENRPVEQGSLMWSDGYKILVNPYPIFPRHLTIACSQHAPQTIMGRVGDMMQMAQVMDNYELFYNGPRCGASAPDHMHFQAGNKGFMPWLDDLKHAEVETVCQTEEARMSIVSGLVRAAVMIEATTVAAGEDMFQQLAGSLPVNEGDIEPMLNVLCSYQSGKWQVTVFPRKRHRPSCYYSEGEQQILISPASVDMGGVLAVPLEKDFNKIGEKEITEIFGELCYSAAEIREMTKHLAR